MEQAGDEAHKPLEFTFPKGQFVKLTSFPIHFRGDTDNSYYWWLLVVITSYENGQTNIKFVGMPPFHCNCTLSYVILLTCCNVHMASVVCIVLLHYI